MLVNNRKQYTDKQAYTKTVTRIQRKGNKEERCRSTVVYDVVEKHRLVVWKSNPLRRRRKKNIKNRTFNKNFLRFTYSNNTHTEILVAYF